MEGPLYPIPIFTARQARSPCACERSPSQNIEAPLVYLPYQKPAGYESIYGLPATVATIVESKGDGTGGLGVTAVAISPRKASGDARWSKV